MLVTQQPVFQRFWYPVMPRSHLLKQPQKFELLGQKIVLWLNNSGKVIAAKDRCCHRSAQLSQGKVIDGNIICPYHGWSFNSKGDCVKVPQLEDSDQIPKTYQIKTYNCQEHYSYIWVCLGEPLNKIPEIAEAKEPNFRLIPEFYETWNCAGLRVMENEFDLAHPTFVHTTTFGSEAHPIPDDIEVEETEYGIHSTATLNVVNPKQQQQNLKMSEEVITRTLDMNWYLPFTAKIRINYPNGLVHIIVNTATPINDSTSQIVQFCLRNDTETETKAEDIIAFDRAVTLEDKAILETTDYNVPLDLKLEQHMMSDKPGILMRQKLKALLRNAVMPLATSY
ncbi:MAG: aromatic ring-hydroxylating dioxygenase subunit alpha [Spirulinaceae cyanobacterium]